MSQHTLLPLSSSVRPLLVVFLFLFNMSKNGTQVSSSSVSGGSGPRDVLWERAIASLPEPLLRALLDADLGDALTLQNYPRMEGHLLEEMLGGSLVGAVGTASSDASSSTQPTIMSTGTCTMVADGDVGEGGDPRTVHSLPVEETQMAATFPPYRPGGLATQTAKSESVPVSPALRTVSTIHLHGSAVLDGLSENPEHSDGLPRSTVFENSSLLDRIFQKKYSIGILRDFHTVKVSESLRQSQLDQVQIVPPSLVPSELSAHQMAARSDGSLARSGVDGHPSSALSLQDKVLLHKYSIPVSIGTSIATAEGSFVQSERDECMIRSEVPQKAEDRVKVDQRDPRTSGSKASGSADQLVQSSSSVSKDSAETDPKRRRRVGKLGVRKEPRDNCGGTSVPKNVETQFVEGPPNIPLDSRDCIVVQKCGLTDMVNLYITLLMDKVIPAGFLAEFLLLEHSLKASSRRFMNQAASRSDAEAERLLAIDKKQKVTHVLTSFAASDQLVLASELKPRKFRTKWQRIIYEGPTARKDMEDAERSRWVAFFGDLLRHTDTPMGRLLRESPSNIQLRGSGLRAGTLRSRVRSIRKFLEWLSTAHKIAFPVHWQQFIEFLQVRLSEPCVRGSLKSAHRSFLFLQESAGISDKFTDSALYDVARKELFAAALPVRAPRQAPRFPSILLGAFEDNVMDSSLPVFWRVLSWWLLFQSWSTLRFDDHRGIIPEDLEISEAGLVGKLSRSKVTGRDKRVAFRVLVIHPSAFVHQKDWLITGWAVLSKEAPYVRDYLLPAPANNFRGFKRKELTYHTTFAVQSQIVSLAAYRGLRIFRTQTPHYYTPHSGRNFMPTSTAVLGFSKSDRDMLGGWVNDTPGQRSSR